MSRQAEKTSRAGAGRGLTRRDSLALGAGVAVGMFGTVARPLAAPVSMRFGSDSPITSAHSKSAVVMKELIESGTSGRVQVTIFPDAQLGGNGPMLNSVKAGTLDALMIDVGHLSAAVPQADVFNLPFLFWDIPQVMRIANGPIGTQLKPKIEEAFACEVLGWAVDGSTDMWNGKRPIRTPADLSGLKMGVGSSKIQRDTILAFGGIPTSLEIPAIYMALQTGLIDGTTKTPADAIEWKMYQVTKYLTLTRHYSMPNALIVSKKFMEKLGGEDRAVVRTAGEPAAAAHVEAVLKKEMADLAFLREKGIQIFPLEGREAFAAKMEPVYRDAAERIGAEIVEEARRLAAGG